VLSEYHALADTVKPLRLCLRPNCLLARPVLALRRLATFKHFHQLFQALEEFIVRTTMLRTIMFGALLGAFVTLTNTSVWAQGPRYVSPRRSVALEFPPRDAPKKITIDYGSPEAHGRKVMGELVPFDKPWRLGANKATHLTTDFELVFGTTTVPAGTYTLFAYPSKDKWVLEINKTTNVWGIPYKPEYAQTVLAKIDMKVESVSAPQERFLITLTQSGTDHSLVFEWENTRASVNFTKK
jgi:hypothetical protein